MIATVFCCKQNTIDRCLHKESMNGWTYHQNITKNGTSDGSPRHTDCWITGDWIPEILAVQELQDVNFSHIGSDGKWLCFLEPWARKTNGCVIQYFCRMPTIQDKCRKFRRFLWRFPHFQKNRFMRCLDQLKLHIHNLKSITIHLVN